MTGSLTVSLYPNVKNKFVNWPGGRIPKGKKVVSDRYVKCMMQKAECRIKSKVTEEGKGESRRDRKLPMEGQERMKI